MCHITTNVDGVLSVVTFSHDKKTISITLSDKSFQVPLYHIKMAQRNKENTSNVILDGEGYQAAYIVPCPDGKKIRLRKLLLESLIPELQPTSTKEVMVEK